jgi:pimeloyl-ACP methyl ester carboxylesterase
MGRSAAAVEIREDDVVRGVRRREFVVRGEGRHVPGALWTPAPGAPQLGGSAEENESTARPLVLIGHGASGSKYQDYVRSLAATLVREHGIAATAIDGPVHGSRREDGGSDGQRAFLDFAAAWSSDAGLTDRMVDDWRRTLDALSALGVGGGAVGYWGLSMGTILGLPFVAAEPRISVAVLGLMGATGPTAERLVHDARHVTCPVLFLVQWSDELFARETAFELFDLIGSTDKTLHANPGSHGAVPEREFAASTRFLADQLRPRTA